MRAELLCEMRLDLASALGLPGDASPRRPRLMEALRGGRCAGPQLKGTVYTDKGNALGLRPAGERTPDVWLTLNTDNGPRIALAYQGLAWIWPRMSGWTGHGPPEEWAGSSFRIPPVCATQAAQYGWLNRLVAVGIGRWTPTGVASTVYASR